MQTILSSFLKVIAFVTFTCIVCCMATQAQTKLNIDNDWKFHFGHASNPEKDFN